MSILFTLRYEALELSANLIYMKNLLKQWGMSGLGIKTLNSIESEMDLKREEVQNIPHTEDGLEPVTLCISIWHTT